MMTWQQISPGARWSATAAPAASLPLKKRRKVGEGEYLIAARILVRPRCACLASVQVSVNRRNNPEEIHG